MAIKNIKPLHTHLSPPPSASTVRSQFGVQGVLLRPQRRLRLFRLVFAATQLEREQKGDKQQEQDDGDENAEEGAGLALRLCAAS